MKALEKLAWMKKWILTAVCFCFTLSCYSMSSYEKELERFCHQAEALLELQGHEILLDLSNSGFLESSYDGAIVFFPEDPVQALNHLKTYLKPGAKALFIFYPSDTIFYQLSEQTHLAASVKEFRSEAKRLRFSIRYFELKRHVAYFEDLVELTEFTNQYLHFSKIKPSKQAFLENQIRIPSKIVVAVVEAPKGK